VANEGLRQMADVIEELEARVQGEERVYWTVVQALEERVGDLEDVAEQWRASVPSIRCGTRRRVDDLAGVPSVDFDEAPSGGTTPRQTLRAAIGIAQDPAAQKRGFGVTHEPEAKQVPANRLSPRLLNLKGRAPGAGAATAANAAHVVGTRASAGTRKLLDFAEYARRTDTQSRSMAPRRPWDAATEDDGLSFVSSAATGMPLLLEAGHRSDPMRRGSNRRSLGAGAPMTAAAAANVEVHQPVDGRKSSASVVSVDDFKAAARFSGPSGQRLCRRNRFTGIVSHAGPC